MPHWPPGKPLGLQPTLSVLMHTLGIAPVVQKDPEVAERHGGLHGPGGHTAAAGQGEVVRVNAQRFLQGIGAGVGAGG